MSTCSPKARDAECETVVAVSLYVLVLTVFIGRRVAGLQKLVPTTRGAIETSLSSVQLKESDFNRSRT